MRIAYVYDWVESTGVAAKVRGQVACWRAHDGVDADLFTLAPDGTDPTAAVGGHAFTFRSLRSREAATRRLAAAVRAFRPDVLYVRYDLFFAAVARLAGELPTVVEVNTDLRRELGLRSGAAAVSLYEPLNRRLLLGRASGLVCVTNELAAAPWVRSLGKETIVVSNGIELAGIAPCPPPLQATLRLVFVGVLDSPWHGLDKLLSLAEECPEFGFDVVGPLSAQPSAPANVIWHGELDAPSLRKVICAADVGVATLALHRKGMDEASPLKTREYLAHGLPVILGYRDTDLAGDDLWYVLRLPNTETNVRDNVARIRAFAGAVKGRRVARKDVAERIDLTRKEALRIEFLRKVRDSGR